MNIFELLNYFLGMICFSGSIIAFILAILYFKEKDFWNIVLGVVVSIFGIILFGFFLVAFFII